MDYGILIAAFTVSAVTLLLIYGSDKELKYLHQLNIKKVKLLSLKRSKAFFIYSKREENKITLYAFICMIAYYVINILGVVLLFAHLITKCDLLFVLSCATIYLNFLILIVSGMKIYPSKEKQEIMLEEHKKRNHK